MLASAGRPPIGFAVYAPSKSNQSFRNPRIDIGMPYLCLSTRQIVSLRTPLG